MSRLIGSLALVFLLASSVSSDVKAQIKQGTDKSGLSEEAVTRLQAAIELSNSGKPRIALDTLGPLASDIKTPWEVRVLVAELHEKSGNLATAKRFYESVADELGDKIWKLPGNLYFRLGTVSFGLKDYEQASHYLERGMRYPGYLDDPRIFEMLAISYSYINRPSFAWRATILHAASDPKAKPDLAKLGATIDNSDLPPLPAVPDPETLRKLLAAPSPTDPATEPNLLLSALSINYASVLKSLGWTHASERYDTAAYTLLFGRAAGEIDDDSKNEDGLEELARLSEIKGYDNLPPKLIAAGVQLEMQAHVNLGEFSHAAAALERLAKLETYDKANIQDIAIKLQRIAFANVSFEMRSGNPRSRDPREFIDTTHLAVVAEQSGPKKTSKSIKNRRDTAKQPYAEVSQSEDWAEITAAVVSAKAYPAVKKEIINILTKCLDDKKFELPVKFSLHMLASSFLDEKTEAGVTLRKRLEREIYGSVKPPRPTTLDAFKAGERLTVLLK